MALLLKRNSTPDPWYSTHGDSVKKGEVVLLTYIFNEDNRNAQFPPEISIKRNVASRDPYIYRASLCCYDYVGSTK